MTTLGYKVVTFDGPKRPCARCGRRVRSGYVNPANVDGNCLCFMCLRLIMSSPGPESNFDQN